MLIITMLLICIGVFSFMSLLAIRSEERRVGNLEINCNNCDWFNLIYTTELQLNKSFTCDECEELILICDIELMNQVKGENYVL